MPNHRATATQLSMLLNYKKHGGVNFQYSSIAKKISEFTGKYPYKRNRTYFWWSLLSSGAYEGTKFVFTMRPIVVEVIEELNLFTENESLFPEEVFARKGTFREGLAKEVLVNSYERNINARNKAIEHHGLDCKVCGFNFEKVFGEIGKNFIHVHHIVPISEVKEDYEINPSEDLVPVCPNCHAMLHRSNPVMKVEELKKKLSSK